MLYVDASVDFVKFHRAEGQGPVSLYIDGTTTGPSLWATSLQQGEDCQIIIAENKSRAELAELAESVQAWSFWSAHGRHRGHGLHDKSLLFPGWVLGFQNHQTNQ
jgi:hypothetical protein